MLKNVLQFYHQAVKALEKGIPLEEIVEAKIREKIARQKYVPEEKIEEIEGLSKEIENYFAKIPVGEV
jgi:V/A-type H+-transporting ATPase subunit A